MNNFLKCKCKNYIAEFGIPVTTFCKKIKLSTQAYYRWQRDELNLKETTEQRISNYLDNVLKRVTDNLKG